MAIWWPIIIAAFLGVLAVLLICIIVLYMQIYYLEEEAIERTKKIERMKENMKTKSSQQSSDTTVNTSNPSTVSKLTVEPETLKALFMVLQSSKVDTSSISKTAKASQARTQEHERPSSSSFAQVQDETQKPLPRKTVTPLRSGFQQNIHDIFKSEFRQTMHSMDNYEVPQAKRKSVAIQRESQGRRKSMATQRESQGRRKSMATQRESQARRKSMAPQKEGQARKSIILSPPDSDEWDSSSL